VTRPDRRADRIAVCRLRWPKLHRRAAAGLVCHRDIYEICQLAGIQDLIANVKGSMNPMNLVKAAFMVRANAHAP